LDGVANFFGLEAFDQALIKKKHGVDTLAHQFCVQRHVASFQVKRQKATAIFYLSKKCS
jgi:hypothetical protein